MRQNWIDKKTKSTNTTSKSKEIDNKIKGYNIELKELESRIKNFKTKNSSALKKVHELQAWILYSREYVKTIVDEVIKTAQSDTQEILDYSILKDAIEKPRQILSSLYLFRKSK